jgi:hypothetical protein
VPGWQGLKLHLRVRYGAVAAADAHLELAVPLGAGALSQPVSVRLAPVEGRTCVMVLAEVCPVGLCDPHRALVLSGDLGGGCLVIADGTLWVRRLADLAVVDVDALDDFIDACTNDALTARLVLTRSRYPAGGRPGDREMLVD